MGEQYLKNIQQLQAEALKANEISQILEETITDELKSKIV